LKSRLHVLFNLQQFGDESCKGCNVVICVVAVALASSQPTSDVCGVSDCGCEKKLNTLQKQITLLNRNIDSILNKRKTKEIAQHLTTRPSVSNKPTIRMTTIRLNFCLSCSMSLLLYMFVYCFFLL